MIVTCASCLTKFSLDESKIPAQGAKVRCSRCKHVFRIIPPPVTQEEEEVVEGFESFAKSHGDLIEPGVKSWEPAKPEKSPPEPGKRISLEEEEPPGAEEASAVSEKVKTASEQQEEEESFFVEKGPAKRARRTEGRGIWDEAERSEEKIFERTKTARKKKRSSLIFGLLVVLILLIFGAFYLWSELETSGKLARYVEAPIKKVTLLWDKLWKAEKEGLIIRDLNGYEEKVGDISLFVIEGTVNNQSGSSKKYIKVKVVILDQDKTEIATQETICGPAIRREDLKSLPPAFFQKEIVLKPQTEKEMVVPANQSIPFIVIFKDLPSQAKEFKVDIVDAPNL